MTAIGKLLVVLALVAGLGVLAWSANVYTLRPGWFEKESPSVDKGHSPLTFEQMKTEIDTLHRSAAAVSAAWGRELAVLEEREKYRDQRRAGYAERLLWAHKGHPSDRVNPKNPKSPGIGFYEPVIDSTTGLHDLTKRGRPVRDTNNNPLAGLDVQEASIATDVAEIERLSNEIKAQREAFDTISQQVLDTEQRAFKMTVIRDSIQTELFFLETFEVSIFETRETVFRRNDQLKKRLQQLGIVNP